MQANLQRLVTKINALSGTKAFKRMDYVLAVLVTLSALVVYAYTETSGRNAAGLRFIENIEARSLDARFNLRGARIHDENIVIVGLDESTLQKVGAYPIPRDAYARMVDRLAHDGARLIVFDANFPVPEKNSAIDALQELEAEVKGKATPQVIDEIRAIESTSDNDKIFAASLKRAGNVVLGHMFLDTERAKSVSASGAEAYFRTLWDHPFPQMLKAPNSRDFDMNRAWTANGGAVAQGVYANIQLLADNARSFGFFDEEPDSDGTYRHAILLIRYQDQDWYPSIDVEAVRQAENIPNENISGWIAENGLDHIELGPHVFSPAHDGSALINYAGPYRTYKHYSMIDVIEGKFAPGAFKGKIVLYGATAVGIADIRNTPYQTSSDGRSVNYMGVELHANIIDNLLHVNEHGRGFLSRGYKEEAIDIGFILAFGLGLGFWFSRAKPLTATTSVIAALAIFAVSVYYAFAHFGMWLSFVVPAGTLVANYATITSFRMIFEEREKRKVRKTFERYVSPGVIALIEKDPKKYFKTGGESKELTVMFSDIRDFTKLSEGLTPNGLVALLNEYLGDMTDILFTRWGTLDKYIGDAIMGFWGSPFPQDDHAIRACACALDMRARLKELNAKWESEGRKQLAIGVGLNTGEVNVGNMGSSKRFAWTVMGDNVNLASRLEGITKEYHVQCVVSESTYRAAKDGYVFREIDRIRVKGKTKPVTIYELLDWGRNESLYTERIVRFSEALTAYRRQQWSEAIELFEKIYYKFPEDGPAGTFIARSRELMSVPPEPNWDGVYAMKTK